MRRCSKLLALAAILLSVPAIAQEAERPQLALMGTIPIYWGEADGFDAVVRGDSEPHWARALIEEAAEPVPIDYLSAEALAPYHFLLMAQPRGLAPEENVALDAWVRGGGKLLLFADPMMTGESRFGIGDRRRPQDVALLSPILAHWGLELQFDPAQEEGLVAVDHFGDRLPVNLRGTLEPLAGREDCAIPGDGLLAHCSLGTGQALIVADAAMLDIAGPYEGARGALASLLGHIFPEIGDFAGNPAADSELRGQNDRNPPVFAREGKRARRVEPVNPP